MLFLLNIRVKATLFFHWVISLKYYYSIKYACTDLLLLLFYFFKNPFRVSREFLEQKLVKDVYTYGETPPHTLEKLVRECGLNAEDCIYELGCGRGKSVFWFSEVLKAQTVGIEYTPLFTKRALRVKNILSCERAHFLCEDYYEADLGDATCIYLYASSLSNAELEVLVYQLRKLKKGTKVISISYPLNQVMGGEIFEIKKCFPVTLTWGSTEAYYQVKRT